MQTSERPEGAGAIAHRVVIIGAGLAGLRVAEELRRAGYTGEITLLGSERHLPYDRPPLSKEVMRGEREDTTLKPRGFFEENRIGLRLGVAASCVNTARKLVALADGTVIGYDDLVIATGLRPRRPRGLPALEGVHVLRTFDDMLALRADLRASNRVLVVGAGFIGCELAASFRTVGREVVLIDVQSAPLAAVFGQDVGRLVERLHRAEGVDVRGGIGLGSLTGNGRVSGAVLTDGSELEVDLVVLGVGSDPVTGWLADSGIRLADPAAGGGVLTDECGRTSVEDVWATGDVAAWLNAAGEHRRIEHWSNASDQAKVLVKALLGNDAPRITQVPYFWSDQYDVKIQAFGTPSSQDIVHLVEDDGRKFLAVYESGGHLTAVIGAGKPREVMKLRTKVAAAAPIEDVITRH